ncbi:Na+/H+ antiporter NhaC family protein [Aporhodopirellula aestuarii]|uniref:Na+/H+ antiporter NhaC-like C-terminal domain-containing protein n=1 Tax=Aporhodopirellula aestuarii TaxID=2950107 RepID=A0ABT0U407_9BACT|nr:Na+/H+ antiporter NhaC family protein [Aporhodopirellula aestuarii]MCM2371660.1 hypothetical protein [Aporhodopirellula aestuarii]
MEYGYTSLLPPLIAIALALLTQRVLLPLAAGILIGAGLLAFGQNDVGFVRSTWDIFTTSIIDSVTDYDHLRVLAFTLVLGMMVGVIEAAGSMRRTIARLARRVRDRRGAQGMIAATGLAVFFDDYANTLLVGGTMRSTADRFGISRAKLAYLVDSTAAPVAGLALVSTWVATELSYLQAGMDASAYAGDGSSVPVFDFFIQSIPYRFYPWFALALVFIIARTGRDFGPMRVAEHDAVNQSLDALKTESETGDETPSAEQPATQKPAADILTALLPIAACLVAILVVLVVSGKQSLMADAPLASPTDAPIDTGVMSKIRFAGDVIGSGDSYTALMYGGGCGLAFAVVLAFFVSKLTAPKLLDGVRDGALQMMPAMAVLWLAWSLSAMTGKEALDTGGYLSSVLSDRIDIRLMPTCVFILAGAIAFATGTSWGTMAIVTPIAVSLVLDMQAHTVAQITETAINSPIALATFSGVLAGAIFGDHCSPISDTTVLSSRACGCDHVLHVRTQMPYALLAGGVCILTGTLPVAFGVPVWLCLTVGTLALVVTVRLLGQQPAT